MDSSVKFCGECGASLSDEMHFCGECGQSLFTEAESSENDLPPEPEKASKTSRKSRTLLIVTSILVIIAISIAAFLLSQQNNIEIPAISQPAEVAIDENYVISYVRVGRKAYENGDYEELRKAVTGGLKYYPELPELWTLKALYHLKSPSSPERGELALGAAKRALELETTPRHSANVGWVYYILLHDYSSALSYFKRGETGGYGELDPNLYFFLAVCYDKTGLFNDATTYYKLFLDIVPNGDNSAEARGRLEFVSTGNTIQYWE